MIVMHSTTIPLASILNWFTGGSSHQYMPLDHCMDHDWFWIGLTVTLDFAVASGYGMIAMHWWKNQKLVPPTPARRALGTMRNIFVFCGICGYLFIPIKMIWPAWRLYDLFMIALVYFTWRYAWRARDLKVVYNELGRSTRLAEDLEKSREESRRKSSFLNAISHDLRTPLNGLMLQANLAELSLKTNDAESLRGAVHEMKASAKATAELLDSLLECARVDFVDAGEAAKTTSVLCLTDMVSALASGLQAQASTKGLTVRTSCPEGLFARTDRVKLERILANLLSNALKFTAHGGIGIEVQKCGAGVEIHVLDTGAGIPPEHRDRIFEEFFQIHNLERDRAKGFGLGLSIARRLARQLGGDITVDSSVGGGSRFTVLLPDVLIQHPGAASGNGNGDGHPRGDVIASAK
jgi:signal transduction histidine kinase